MVGRNADYYDAHAPTVNLENVTSSDENAIILQKLRDNDPNLTCLWIEQDIDDDVSCEFVVREGDDLGWLGYFLGGSTTLTKLHIYYLPQEKWRIIAFIRELVSNRSIQKLAVSTNLGDGFHSLGTLLKSDTLVTLEFNSYGNNFHTIDLQCARDIAIMLGQQNQCNHLTSLVFEEIHISGEAMAEIAPALSAHPQLEKLDLYWDIPPGGRRGSVALGRLLGGWKKPALKELFLCYDVFDGEGLNALVAGMRNCRNLNKLSLGWNSITANGCRSLSTLLQFDNCCLEHLRLNIYNVDGNCAAALATGLVNLCSLKSLSLSYSSFRDGLSALAPAIASLRLLETLSFAYNSIGNDGVRAIAGELTNLHFLDVLDLSYSSIGDEGAGALAAGLMGLRSLKKLDLSGNPIGNEGATILADGLMNLQSLEKVDLSHNTIGDEGVTNLAPALATLGSLENLGLGGNSIGDEGLQALVEGISHCSKLSKLYLFGNRSITTLGVISLSTLLRSGSCSLTDLTLSDTRFGDDGAAALADGLKGKKLRELLFFPNEAGLTPVGWSAFSKLLCDTSSVNNTYLSNHTLKTIGYWGHRGAPDDVKELLDSNKHPAEHVAIHKILKCHPDFDVEPFFEWNLKVLPLVVSWFERVITLMNVDDHKWISDESLEAIQSRKLSTMYKFIRGLPHMTTGDDYRSRKNPTKFAFLRRKISNRCLSHLLNGMALRRRVKNAHTNRSD